MLFTNKDVKMWSLKDKKLLLQALNQHGESNLRLVQKKLPHKTLEEIRLICEDYSKKARKRWSDKVKGEIYIHTWLKVLKKINYAQKGAVQDIISRVLKYIALFEKRRHSTHINLRDCYLVLSDMSNGLASKKLDKTSNYFLHECLFMLSKSMKQGQIGLMREYLTSLKNLSNFINTNEIKAKNTSSEFSAIINPLKIPNGLLQLTELEKKAHILE